MKTTSPMKKKKKAKTKKACVLHLSHNDSFRDSLCARDKDTLTLSASVTEATNGCWRGAAAAKQQLLALCWSAGVCERLGDGWVFCVWLDV